MNNYVYGLFPGLLSCLLLYCWTCLFSLFLSFLSSLLSYCLLYYWTDFSPYSFLLFFLMYFFLRVLFCFSKATISLSLKSEVQEGFGKQTNFFSPKKSNYHSFFQSCTVEFMREFYVNKYLPPWNDWSKGYVCSLFVLCCLLWCGLQRVCTGEDSGRGRRCAITDGYLCYQLQHQP